MGSTALLRSLCRRNVSFSSASGYRLLAGNVNPARATSSSARSWGDLSRCSSSVGGQLGAAGSRVADFEVQTSKIVPSAEGVRTLPSMFAFTQLGALLGTRRVMSTTSREAALHGSRQVLRPLSPHLPVYRPQVSSTSSIFNRITGAFLTGVILAFYLLCLKIGPICYTFESFYQLMFYSSKLTLLSVELSALALAYHVYHSIPHIFR